MGLGEEGNGFDEQPEEEAVDAEDYIDETALTSERCGICMDIVIDRGILDCCNHWFCFACIDNWSTITNLCPLCKQEFQLITCLPVYDALGNFVVEEGTVSRDDDWFIQEKSSTFSFPSYYINEDAVKCLDGDGCKIRSGLSTTEEDPTLDTSIACDLCDIWYHAFCVGFDPENQPGNSWLCPRCIIDEVPQLCDQRITEHGHSVESVYSGKVSIAVADAGETAVVVSMVEEQKSNETIEDFMSSNMLETTSTGDDPERPYGFDASSRKHDMPQNETCDFLNAHVEGHMLVLKPLHDTSTVEASCTNDHIHEQLSIPSASKDSSPFFQARDSFTKNELSKTEKEASTYLDLSVASSDTSLNLSDVKVTYEVTANKDFGYSKHPVETSLPDEKLNNDAEVSNAKVIIEKNTVKGLDRKNKNRSPEKNNAYVKDHTVKRERDSPCHIEDELYPKKSKLDGNSKMMQKVTTSVAGDTQEQNNAEAICEDDNLSSASEPSDIMSIVRGIKSRPSNEPASKSSEVDATKSGNASGLRVKKIMRRTGEDAESTVLVQNLRKAIRDAVSDDPSKDFGKDDAFDGKLLTAFRAAIARPRNETVCRISPSHARVKKSILQKGKVRENLTKKIYKTTNGRRRRAWDRDWEIEFWKHRCLSSKPEKVEALKSILDVLKKATSSENPENKQEPKENADKSILSRVYLADTSVFPRKEDIKPLSALDMSKDHRISTSGKQSPLGHGNYVTETSGEISSNSEQVTIQSSIDTTKKEANSLVLKERALCKNEKRKGLKEESEVSISVSALRGLKEGSQPLAKDDKRKWALEVLARKNASTGSGEVLEKQEDNASLKGSHPLLAQLPADMRPVVAPSRHSKVPLSVRQAQLYRLTEFYLRKANLPVVRRTAATELAVADAINIEKEIFERSNSKLVYINLCSQHTLNCKLQKAEKGGLQQDTSAEDSQKVSENASSDPTGMCLSTEEALKLTGLFSDSPPSSPSQPAERPTGGDVSKSSSDTTKMDIGSEGVESVLDIDANAGMDIYGDFEYDLEDEAYISSSMASTINQSCLQADDGNLKLKVRLSTLNCKELDKALKSEDNPGVPTREKQKTSSSPERVLVADGQSNSGIIPIHEKERITESSILKTSTDGSDPGIDTLDKERQEFSWAECEELYGPENEILAESFPVKVMETDSKNIVSCESKNDSLKDRPSASSFVSADDDITKGILACHAESPGGEILPTYSLKSQDVPQKEERGTPASNLFAPKVSVSQKVEAYIKEHIRPLCKSGVITAEQYRWAVGKTTDKVMKHHCTAKNANFLIKEGDKVKKLAEQYVETAQQKDRKPPVKKQE